MRETGKSKLFTIAGGTRERIKKRPQERSSGRGVLSDLPGEICGRGRW